MDLPHDLDLPLPSGAPWWYWLGGRPALDFVNTRRERWWRDVETLVTPGDLGRWLVQAEVADDPPPRVTRDALADAIRLREAINAGVDAHLASRPFPRSAATVIDGWLPLAEPTPRFVVGGDGLGELRADVDAGRAAHAIALVARDASIMFGTGERGRIRACASETCSARFYDRSRSGMRRWCSMEGCGNVAKARRHRARVRTP